MKVIIIMLSCLPLLASAQQLERYSINSGGSFDITVGDVSTITVEGSFVLSAGFQQGHQEEKTDVSVREQLKAQYQLYPVPFNGNLNLRLSENMNDDAQLSIYNAAGELVHQQSIDADHTQIQTDTWPRGAYFVQLHSAARLLFEHKIVK